MAHYIYFDQLFKLLFVIFMVLLHTVIEQMRDRERQQRSVVIFKLVVLQFTVSILTTKPRGHPCFDSIL